MSDETKTYENERFAFGTNYHDGCACPAETAAQSISIGDAATEAAERYDSYLRSETSKSKGAVDESTARDAWMCVISTLEDGADWERERSNWYADAADSARRIADELGW
jgi:hypothetical protein